MKINILIKYFKTSYGELIIGSYEDRLCLCDWRYRKLRSKIDQRIQKGLNAVYTESDSAVIRQTISELNEYFEGKRTTFGIPLLTVGSDFQKSVWNELLNIPFGETETYLGLSKRMKNVKAIRAVATANGANAISIIIPCHRVLGSKEELIGYAGGLQTKKNLLDLEGYTFNGQTKISF